MSGRPANPPVRITRRRALWLLAATVPASARSEKVTQPMKPTPLEPNAIALDAELQLHQGRLLWRYHFRNASAHELVLMDLLFRLDPAPVLDATLAYTLIEDPVLTLFRGVLAVPPGVQVETPDMPLGRRVAAATVATGHVDLSLPLRLQHPYQWPPGPGSRRFDRLRLRLGFVVAADLAPSSLQAASRDLHGVQALSLRYRDVLPVQQVVQTPERQQSVELLWP